MEKGTDHEAVASLRMKGGEAVRTVDEASERYAVNGGSPLCVIGGEQIYRLFCLMPGRFI